MRTGEVLRVWAKTHARFDDSVQSTFNLIFECMQVLLTSGASTSTQRPCLLLLLLLLLLMLMLIMIHI